MAYGVKSHKFLCCLPVRLGVFVLAFLSMLSAGFTAGVSYYVISQGRIDEQKYKIITIVGAVVMTLLFIVSLLGFIGSILRRKAFVSAFSRTLNWLLAINVLAGAAIIVLLFIADKDAIVDACVDGSTEQNMIDWCNNSVNRYKWVMIALIVVNWAIHFYECVIVARYLLQLQEEKEEKWRQSAMKAYTQVPHRDSTDAFTHPAVSYPYADKGHSYGSYDAAYKA